MLKVRLMGTTEDIVWFWKILHDSPETRITELSAMYPIKRSRRYQRVYVEVEHADKIEEETYHV